MSHTKSHSHGSIPFSWEDKPGVCKILNNNECPLNKGSSLKSLKSSSSSLSPQSPTTHLDKSRKVQEIQGKKIPLPPCLSQPPPPPPPPPPRRSSSGKGFRWQEDPFIVAYKECTKNNNDKLQVKNKKGVGSSFSEKRSKFNFSCRSISDVRDDCYVKLPPIPAVRNRSLTLKNFQNKSSLTLEDFQNKDFNDYESWL